MPKPHFLLLVFLLHISSSFLPLFSRAQQLSASQSQTIFRLRRILEYPPPLVSWNRYTSFCNLPSSSSLSISCSSTGQITKLSISGDRRRPALSANFSSYSLFTTLSRLNSLTSLSLVSLGIWGPLPTKIKRMSSLKSLNLSSNYFNGTFPDFKSMPLLSELDLGENFLGPDFPSLGNNIATLVLQKNRIRSELPALLASLHQLEKLDLSFNQLSGPIPPSLFSLSTLQYLDLSANKLQGAFPATLSCGKDLNFVNISSNLLVGSLPPCIRHNSSNLLVLNSWNCLSTADLIYQHPNSYCMKKPLAAVLPDSNKKAGSKSKLGLILSLVGGIIGLVLLFGLLLLLFIRKVKPEINGVKSLHRTIDDSKSIFSAKRTPADARHMSQGVIIGTLGITPYRVFAFEELEEATKGFDSSNLISDGRQGQFFKGWLQDGSAVIVRSLKLKQKYSSQSLLQYIDIISKLRHRHLVSILGHCIANGEGNANVPSLVFLVFEYVSNGTLRNHLTDWRKREMLKWPQRVTAVIGVAKGLQFLHSVIVPGISGNVLKIENILLDEILTAKISNYNLPVLPKNKNKKVGCEIPFADCGDETFGSIQNFDDGEKKDIYQLGLILLEVITGKPHEAQELDEVRAQLLKSLNESPAKLGAIVDSAIRNTFAHDSLRRAVEIAINCVSKDLKQRPSIDDILWNLQYCIQIQNGWASSENLSTQS
ncbi:probable LRR receptor-like serine/threonine-protein kinase At1g14390 [Phalaenopsis equestris]|uniref:probable LRR receptor-like serine/threonine-protein kinase At1g14390 n=1 Tax=Phalaenopsis equestris TaxID=78828 RepID=UPI0009E3D164|nr:probable LRR receptor-like serine/threonine-protein kinase At1g14390 [Phalaenopsis equestris]